MLHILGTPIINKKIVFETNMQQNTKKARQDELNASFYFKTAK